MKTKKITKVFAIITIALLILLNTVGITNKSYAKLDKNTGYQITENPYQISPQEIIDTYANILASRFQTISCTITPELIKSKNAILTSNSTLSDNKLDTRDASTILTVCTNTYKDTTASDINDMISSIAKETSVNKSDIELECSVYGEAYEDVPEFKYTLNNKTTPQENINDLKSKLAQRCALLKNKGFTVQGDVTDINNTGIFAYSTISVTAKLKDGSIYKLAIAGYTYDKANDKYTKNDYTNNWYFVRTSGDTDYTNKSDFVVEKNYTAIIDGKDVGGDLKDGVFLPKYDENNIEKDADVTVTFTSKTEGVTITAINNTAIPETGANSLGWSYSNKEKTQISKTYKFDEYDNTVANGIVPTEELTLTGLNGKTNKQTVAIQWPFRIIKEHQDPEEITSDTKKVRYEITTNLPIDSEKLPEGWNFTDDSEGKTQHRVYIERDSNHGDYITDITLKANGRDDTVTTNVSIKFNEKLPATTPKTGEAISIALVVIIGLLGLTFFIRRKIK